MTSQRKNTGKEKATDGKEVQVEPPRTLWEAHQVLQKARPRSGASKGAWLAFYERSAALYAEIAEVDRGHHHEALYWHRREKQKAEEVAAELLALRQANEQASGGEA
jgi:hypothetical protein